LYGRQGRVPYKDYSALSYMSIAGGMLKNVTHMYKFICVPRLKYENIIACLLYKDLPTSLKSIPPLFDIVVVSM
jgi:hypothetical protein